MTDSMPFFMSQPCRQPHILYILISYVRMIPIVQFYCARKELIRSLQVRILFSVLSITLFR